MKSKIKTTLHILAMLMVSPLIIAHFLIKGSIRKDIFLFSTQFLSLIPGKPGSYLRIAFNRMTMAYCDTECTIGFATLFSQSDTEIHKGVYIGPQCNIGMSSIGKNTLIASGVHIMSGSKQHTTTDLDTPIKDQGGVFEKITIGEDCWVGNGALIMANIGDKCIVGAGSVVTKDIPDYSIVAGNPAKIIRNRKDN
jgi:virginiamycin A acetyltransferase